MTILSSTRSYDLRRSGASANMQIPPIMELEEAAKKLVWAAKKNGTLKFVPKRFKS